MLTWIVAIFAETAKIQADRKRCKTRWCMSFGIRVNLIWFGVLELMCCLFLIALSFSQGTARVNCSETRLGPVPKGALKEADRSWLNMAFPFPVVFILLNG